MTYVGIMKILMVIFAFLFCLATTPAIAGYGCIADAKGCSDDLGKSSSDSKATACQHCGCHASTANFCSPALTLSKLIILQPPQSTIIILSLPAPLVRHWSRRLPDCSVFFLNNEQLGATMSKIIAVIL
jgi:hypothetical protein